MPHGMLSLADVCARVWADNTSSQYGPAINPTG